MNWDHDPRCLREHPARAGSRSTRAAHTGCQEGEASGVAPGPGTWQQGDGDRRRKPRARARGDKAFIIVQQ